jgi:hypothetical protein
MINKPEDEIDVKIRELKEVLEIKKQNKKNFLEELEKTPLYQKVLLINKEINKINNKIHNIKSNRNRKDDYTKYGKSYYEKNKKEILAKSLLKRMKGVAENE